MSITKIDLVQLPDEIFYEILKRCHKKVIFSISLVSKKYFNLICRTQLFTHQKERFTAKKVYKISIDFGIIEDLTIGEIFLKEIGYIKNVLGRFKETHQRFTASVEIFQNFFKIISSQQECLHDYVLALFNQPILDCSYIRFLYLQIPLKVEWLILIIESKEEKLLELMLPLKPRYYTGAIFKMINLKWDICFIEQTYTCYELSINYQENKACCNYIKDYLPKYKELLFLFQKNRDT